MYVSERDSLLVVCYWCPSSKVKKQAAKSSNYCCCCCCCSCRRYNLLYLQVCAVPTTVTIRSDYVTTNERINVESNVAPKSVECWLPASRLINRANSGTNLKPVYMQQQEQQPQPLPQPNQLQPPSTLTAKPSMKLRVSQPPPPSHITASVLPTPRCIIQD